jgi:hypothetical protein
MGSALAVDEFAAVRSVGFEPVGQVFGAAVYPLSATAAVTCPGSAAHSVVSGPLTGVEGWSGSAALVAQALYDGYRTAGDSFTAATVEVKVIGTAVRAKGCPPLGRPFTTELSGRTSPNCSQTAGCLPASHWAYR